MQHPILVFDIETAPLLSHVWSAKVEYVPYDQMIHDSFMLAWSAKWYGEDPLFGDVLSPSEARHQDDKRIVKSLAVLLRESEMVIAHNVDGFDVPMVNNRILLLGQEPLGPIRTLDTLKLARNSFRLAYNKLDYLARVLGLPRKIKTDFQLWQDAYHGEVGALNQMFIYNQQDVVVLEQVFNKLKPHVKGLPRLFDAEYDGQYMCPSCGGLDFQKRGKHRTNAGNFQTFQCKTCKRYSRVRTADKTTRSALYPL